jgi:hypothetical protein
VDECAGEGAHRNHDVVQLSVFVVEQHRNEENSTVSEAKRSRKWA